MADFVLDCGDWREIQRFCVDFGVFFAKMAGYGGNWRGNNGNSREIRRVYVDMCKIWMTSFAGSIGCSALRFRLRYEKNGVNMADLYFFEISVRCDAKIALNCVNLVRSRAVETADCAAPDEPRVFRFFDSRQSAHCGRKSWRFAMGRTKFAPNRAISVLPRAAETVSRAALDELRVSRFSCLRQSVHCGGKS